MLTAMLLDCRHVLQEVGYWLLGYWVLLEESERQLPTSYC